MTADHPTREERYAAVLAEHRFMPCAHHSPTVDVWWAQCEGCDWKGPRRSFRGHQADHRAHVAAALVAADPAPAQPDAALSDDERKAVWWSDDEGPRAHDDWTCEGDDGEWHWHPGFVQDHQEALGRIRLGLLSPDDVNPEMVAVAAVLREHFPLSTPWNREQALTAIFTALAARAAQPVPAPEVSRGVAEALMDGCAPSGCLCSCHTPDGLSVAHMVPCCDALGGERGDGA